MQTETKSQIKLSILIPTIEEREWEFGQLNKIIAFQIEKYGLHDVVEVLHLKDNKEMTIGEKRQKLYTMATGLYAWQIDDDDAISPRALPRILEAMETEPDCITFEELCVIDGIQSHSNFSLKYIDWGENQDGYDHVRTPFFKTPIKTSICQQVEVPHIRFGEDHRWAQAIKPLLKTEVHIPHQIYCYNHISSPHKERYGIK